MLQSPPVKSRTAVWIGVGLFVGSSACKKPTPPPNPDQASSASPSAAETVPPAAFAQGAPGSVLGDAGSLDGQTPYEQARAYEANGQLWLARLGLEKKALGSSGTTDEVELLARICHAQKDRACVEACEKKLGKKIKLDVVGARRSVDLGKKHEEPETDFTRARAHLLAQRYKDAREILEPKVIDGKGSKEEIRLLRSVCKQESDRMCVALCDAKLK